MKISRKLYAVLLAMLMAVSLCGCQEGTSSQSSNIVTAKKQKSVSANHIPDYSGEMTVVVNHNKPNFSSRDLTMKSFESYSQLDSEGRCQTAEACVGKDLMPTTKRETISMVKPTGWHAVKYDNVEGKYLYNRCHLIAYQLSGENANQKNLITGTRSFNVDGMLPYEEMVGDYVRETGNHVLYRVTPVFEGNNLVAKGVQMEAMSVEDKGEDIEFNVFVYNVQDGIKIDYKTGESKKSSSVHVETTVSTIRRTQHKTASSSQKNSNMEIRGNSRSKVYHCPGQKDYDKMANSSNLKVFPNEKAAKAAGYRKAQR